MLPAAADPAIAAAEAFDPGRDASTGVAVSGGPDSIGAFVLLAGAAASSNRARPIAIHVDHGLRGAAAAEAERRAVAAVAARHAADVAFRRVDVRGAMRRGESLESAARRLRYAELASTARTLGLTHVVVAHHLEDRRETLLLALLRGGGLAALSGPPRFRALIPGVTVARPFLHVPRASLRAAAEGFDVVFDETNDATAHRRNAVRTALIPALIDASQETPALLDAAAEAAASLADGLASACERATRDPAAVVESGLRILPAPGDSGARSRLFAAECVRRALAEDPAYGGPASAAMLEQASDLADKGVGVADLRRGVRVQARAGRLELWAAAPALERGLLLADGERVEFDGVRVFRVTAGAGPEDAFTTVLRAPAGAVVTVRRPRSGDGFPLESGGRAKLADFLCDRKIPAAWRGRIPLLLVDGVVRWIPGLRRCRAGESASDSPWTVTLAGSAPWAPRVT